MNDAALFGPRLDRDGVTFRLWAPGAKRVDVITDRPHAAQQGADGWYEVKVAEAGAGTRYRFRIDGELDIPDPASRFQPEDVSGPGEVIAHNYQWRVTEWRGRPWHEAAFLELH